MNQFLCPECGSKDGGLETLIDKVMNEKSKDPWDLYFKRSNAQVADL